jgi:sugar/nucleoside kinase (ribokinase family)
LPTNLRRRVYEELCARRGALRGQPCFVGFDGFVDTIVQPVARRTGPGDQFTAFGSIAEFGRRITDAAGKSMNLELYPQTEKLGGNGPILAGALLAQGATVTCVGAFGQGGVHPVFADLARRARVVSLCAPARTTAIEFPDGKVMLGMMRSLDEVTPAAIASALGEDGYRSALAAARVVVLGNWTMLPHMTAIYDDLTRRVLPPLPADPARRFFFDLADPEKRSREDLRAALECIGRFPRFGRVTLGLNLRESEQVSTALGIGPEPDTEAGLRSAAAQIRERLGLDAVVVHPKESAAAATAAGTWWVAGPYTDHPLLTTGAGDHFNAGWIAGQLLGLDPEAALIAGVATSGSYVRTGKSPSAPDLESFLANWT